MEIMQKIEIDWEIHQKIELERNGFDEAPYIALRRLLKLAPLPLTSEPQKLAGPVGVAWTDEGVIVPHGSLARMEYLRGSQVYEGQFLNGKLVADGKGFTSLSAAASELAVTREGKKTLLNGWKYWKVKFPDESRWRDFESLRNQAKRLHLR